MFDSYSDIMTIDDVAEALLIGKNNVYQLLNDGKINAFKIGCVWKIPKSEVEEFVINGGTKDKGDNKYAVEYENKGTTRILGTVRAKNTDELKQMIDDGNVDFDSIEDIKFDNPKGKYTVKGVLKGKKICPLIFPEDDFMNPPE